MRHDEDDVDDGVRRLDDVPCCVVAVFVIVDVVVVVVVEDDDADIFGVVSGIEMGSEKNSEERRR